MATSPNAEQFFTAYSVACLADEKASREAGLSFAKNECTERDRAAGIGQGGTWPP
jgi:hypothetical protein